VRGAGRQRERVEMMEKVEKWVLGKKDRGEMMARVAEKG
jgi:hypothetical protein